ncbi:MAG: lipoyl(octanoyl) transferase LipB [FCB group bacterium]|nr:lipoyl(octanoyl) transferase LipB [FCB group bacterium]
MARVADIKDRSCSEGPRILPGGDAVGSSEVRSHLRVLDLGYAEFRETWDLQKDLQAKRIGNEIEDTLILVEHEPVYTLGKNADADHILQNYPPGVKIFRIERGGDVTYHGPGQLVGYPILDLRNYRLSIGWYMRTLEELIIRTVAEFGIQADRKDGLTGVWVDDEKIAAFGVRVSRWVTMHGFALNVCTDLSYYRGIIPCGIFQYGVTSMQQVLGCPVALEKVKEVLIRHFTILFNRKQIGGEL